MSSQNSGLRLSKSLSAFETWGFGFTGLMGWVSAAPILHAALGPQALLVWLPGVVVSILLNLQVKRLGQKWVGVAGGTPNYITRLLNNYPSLARYAALGYFWGWVSFPSINAIVLTDLIKTNLEPLGISSPETLLRIALTAMPFIVALSGTRALGILHLVFVVPAVGFLLLFSIQGLGWLALSPDSPGLLPSSWGSFDLRDWAKWYFFAAYAVCACETATSFVADSRHSGKTLGFLSFVTWLIPIVYLGSSWVLMRLSIAPTAGDAYASLLTSASPFWGQSASSLVTLLIAFSCLLGAATTASNTPRILHQLALDGYLSPVFGVVSRRGVLGPALIFAFLLSLLCLIWGEIAEIMVITGTSYLISLMLLHFGLWSRRGSPEVRWAWLSLGFCGMEAAVLIFGGWAWGWQNLLMGLFLPFGLVMIDAVSRRIAFPPFHRAWWLRFYRPQVRSQPQDFIVLQVGVVIVLVCSTALISWLLRDRLEGISATAKANLMIILLILTAIVAIAISCWTSLPQVMEIAEAREQADHLFQVASDAILVLDSEGSICQANPAAEILFQTSTEHLLRQPLNRFLMGLSEPPDHWLSRSEQALRPQGNEGARVVEVTISDHFSQGMQQYMGVFRDVTERKQAEVQLRHQAEQERLLKDISWRIRHSLDLNDILSTAVAEVRSLLQAERVTVYRLRAGSEGRFVVESTQPGCPSVLEIALHDPCFEAEYAQKYQQGWVPVIADIHQADLDPSHLDLLIRAGIRASLSVPIEVNDCLWGLLCAHQCSQPRSWQPFEVDLLQQLGLQMAVAIQQSDLYQQVQHLNNHLDCQVQERTAELQIALEFEAMLKRIGDKVRDSLDERQIFQTVVEELAQVLDLSICNTSVYDTDQGTATICHEYAIAVPLVQGQVMQMGDFEEEYCQLLQGQYFQFCQLVPKTPRPMAILACPIVARLTLEESDQLVLGDLWLFRSPHETFSDADIRLVQQVANQCAIATRQARLYQAVQTQVEELAKLNQLKDDFLSTVSHELRTPVSNMKLSIRMLELTVEQLDSLNPVSERASRYLQILDKECEREISLINDLLDLQRLEAGSGTLDPEFLQLESWLPQLAEAFRERTQSRQQILQLDLALDLPPMLCDRPSLERVLMELLNNACKYTPPGETITLSAQVIAGQFLICVTNSGVEIPEGEQLQIFEKFHRVPNSDRWRQGGTGLGLTLVKKLTEHMGGTVQVTSGSGQTCFTIAKSILGDVG